VRVRTVRRPIRAGLQRLDQRGDVRLRDVRDIACACEERVRRRARARLIRTAPRFRPALRGAVVIELKLHRTRSRPRRPGDPLRVGNELFLLRPHHEHMRRRVQIVEHVNQDLVGRRQDVITSRGVGIAQQLQVAVGSVSGRVGEVPLPEVRRLVAEPAQELAVGRKSRLERRAGRGGRREQPLLVGIQPREDCRASGTARVPRAVVALEPHAVLPQVE
jgi:hypothetical protein